MLHVVDDKGDDRDSTVVMALAFHQCRLGSIPSVDAICGLSVVECCCCCEGFSLGTPVFRHPPTFQNSNSNKQWMKEPFCGSH